MKKLFLTFFSIVAVVSSTFIGSQSVKAGGGPHIRLTSSTGSWELSQDKSIVVTATVFPNTTKVTHFYMYLDNSEVVHCTQRITCSYTVKNQTIGTHTLTAYAIDSSGNFYFVQNPAAGYQNITVTSASVPAPTVTLTQSGTAYAAVTSTSDFSLQAVAKGNSIKSLKITRSDDTTKTVTTSCSGNSCTLTVRPLFLNSEIGNTYTYIASVTDAQGKTVSSSKVVIKVMQKNTPATPPSTTINPRLTLTPNVVQMKTTDTLTLRGDVTNSNGVWGMEVRAKPSWNTPVLKNRCILSNKPTTGTCSLNIGSFTGHAGETVKVWVIYWDARTGLGYSSEQKVITLKQ